MNQRVSPQKGRNAKHHYFYNPVASSPLLSSSVIKYMGVILGSAHGVPKVKSGFLYTEHAIPWTMNMTFFFF